MPGAHVARLLLRPDHFAGNRIPQQDVLDLRLGKRINLLDAHDGHVIRILLFARCHQVVINLSRTENQALHATGIQIRSFIQHFAEAAAHQLGEYGGGVRVPQQALRCKDHQRLAHPPAVRASAHLPPQQVKILRGRRAVGDLHVLLGR